jgi:hypothetical protein
MAGPTWLEAMDEWRRHLVRELTALPGTLTDLRQGVENFNRVTKRLVDATESVEQFNALQNGVLRTLREQVGSASGDVTGTLNALARLNPFWPRPPEEPKPPGAGTD